MARKKIFNATIAGTVSEVFSALGVTLAFRRWPTLGTPPEPQLLPTTGYRYQYQAGSVRREGRVVEVIRPVVVTLKELLHDPPCCVDLSMRWRIDSMSTGVSVRLCVEYRLNHAAALRARHWDRRLTAHFKKQFAYLAGNLRKIQNAHQVPQKAAENVT